MSAETFPSNNEGRETEKDPAVQHLEWLLQLLPYLPEKLESVLNKKAKQLLEESIAVYSEYLATYIPSLPCFRNSLDLTSTNY